MLKNRFIMKFLRNFKQISKNDVFLAGGKGASLGEMTQAGIPVPPGFVIFANSFEHFLKETDLNVEIEAVLDSVNHKEMHTVENASEKIQALILETEIPQNITKEIEKYFKDLNAQYVAVRSSATAEDGKEHAWAGQLDSYLNTTERDLLEKVRRCWASLFTPRAIFYRFEKGLQKTKISVAVVVQKMVNSEISGIAFSVHPVTEDRNQIIIEAGFGLGEAIVSGQITPDAYVVEKEPRSIIDINVNTQTKGLYRTESGGNQWQDISEPKASSQVLNEFQILELSAIIIGIEKHYGFPCDIEWAFENGKFYIVQSRPITTLSNEVNITFEKDPSIVDTLLKKSKDQKIIRIDGDLIPFLAMMDWLNFYDENNHLINIYPSAFYFSKVRTVGYISQMYLDCAGYTLHQLLSDNMQIQSVAKKYNIITEKIKKTYDKYFTKNLLAQELEQDLLTIFKTTHDELQELIARTLFIEQMDEGTVREVLAEYKIDNINKLWDIVKTPHFLTFESRNNQAITEVIKNKRKLNYLSYVFINYTFIPNLRYIEDTVEKIELDKMERALKDIKINIKKASAKYTSEINRLSVFDKKIVEILNWVIQARDERKDIINMAQMLLFSIGERLFSLWQLDVSLLRYTGMYEILQGKSHISSVYDEIKKRPNGFGVLYNSDLSYRMEYTGFEDGIKKLDDLVLKQNKNDASLIKGEIGNKGKIIGKIHIILRRDQFDEFKDGEILVTGMTRPEFVPLMKKASAIITDEGGITCHAAIVSRELDIPCIIGTKIATQVLKDGYLVEVDADEGIVRIISKKEAEKLSVSDNEHLIETAKK
jgi:phosphohistidine swiveling domain-containing protein